MIRDDCHSTGRLYGRSAISLLQVWAILVETEATVLVEAALNVLLHQVRILMFVVPVGRVTVCDPYERVVAYSEAWISVGCDLLRRRLPAVLYLS